MSDLGFRSELLKLFLQAACADGRVHQVEAKIILGLARNWGFSETDQAALESALARGSGLPAPNLAVLRSNPQKVLEGLQLLTYADGCLMVDEHTLVREVEQILGTRLKPEDRS